MTLCTQQLKRIVQLFNLLIAGAEKRKKIYGLQTSEISSASSWTVFWSYKGVPKGLRMIRDHFVEAAGEKDLDSAEAFDGWAADWLNNFRFPKSFRLDYGCSISYLNSFVTRFAKSIEEKGIAGLNEQNIPRI